MGKSPRGKNVTGLYFDEELVKVLKIAAAMEGRTISNIASDAVNAYLCEKYGEDVLEALKRCHEPLEVAAIYSAIEVKDGTPVEDTFLSRLMRLSRERT